LNERENTLTDLEFGSNTVGENELHKNKKEHAQFFTPIAVAEFLASLATPTQKSKIRILDPGAGTGVLSISLIHQLITSEKSIKSIELKAVEIDDSLLSQLEIALKDCNKFCEENKVEFSYEIINKDFLEISYSEVYETKHKDFFVGENEKLGLFDYIIMNPPYRKINNSSTSRRILDYLGEKSTNLYTAFLSLASYLLFNNGRLIAITPRSFCNGSYYRKFRTSFFSRTNFHRIHIYSSRNKTFYEDEVLQENILFAVSPEKPQNNLVLITSNNSPGDTTLQTITVNHDLVILPNDENKIVHVITDEYSVKIIEKISMLSQKLSDEGIEVSTGRVVDFRIKEELTLITESNATALFYPFHLRNGEVVWPRYSNKKKEAININQNTNEVLVKSGNYVFCKRFSSKEEKKRIVASFYEGNRYGFGVIGIENHLNYFHINNNPLTRELALGLTAYLNSTLVDQYFRLFNGHTQVNAEDLRYIPIPSKQQLESIGNTIENLEDQDVIDSTIEKELFGMKEKDNPVLIRKRIDEAMLVLKQLGLPKDQQNERSALTFLSLLNLKPADSWTKSKPTMLGITAIMNFIKENYRKEYAPNSRESIRRQTVHQFIQAGIIIANPDKPRPVNSPNFVYEIEKHTLELVKTFKTKNWENNLKKYLSKIKTLVSIYEQKRELNKITLRVAEEVNIYLSSGGQNKLIEKIIKDFCEYFTPKGTLIYIGDAKAKWTYFNEQALSKVGVKIKDTHGKMPDLIIHYKEKNWLILIEAVISHGPIDPKRKIELEQLFGSSKAGLVFITSFLNKKDLVKHIDRIAWETEVWVADNPTHLVHLNGKRFLGPYSKT
jgi:adenine-specific DNA-methyltransferase